MDRNDDADDCGAAAPPSGPSAEAMTVQLVGVPAHADRSEHFAAYSELRGSGAVEVPPHLLGPRERRLHIRNTLLEDHAVRLHEAPEATEAKFAILADSAFSFFRGTALLYYRDHAGVDGPLPAVFSIGDVHPENFGVMPGADGRPFFTANDFDEAWVAPFTYDVCRGGVGFWLAAEQAGGKPRHCREIVEGFTRAYIEALTRFAADDSEETSRLTADNAPAVLHDAFAKAQRPRSSFLSKRIDLDRQRFLATDRLEPHPELVEELRPVIERYAETVAGPQRPASFFTVHDVALRHGSGTASQGLPRLWVLLEGWSEAGADCVIIELKLARRSALFGLVPSHSYAAKSSAERIVYAHNEFLADGDPLYGAAEIGEHSYVVRERSPMKVGVEVAAFDRSDLVDYAQVCGRALGQLHARSDFYDEGDGREAEHRILAAVHAEVFLADVVEFVQEAAQRVHTDHALFREDFERGAFRSTTGRPGPQSASGQPS